MTSICQTCARMCPSCTVHLFLSSNLNSLSGSNTTRRPHFIIKKEICSKSVKYAEKKCTSVCMNRKILIFINGALVVVVVVHLRETENGETTSMARIGALAKVTHVIINTSTRRTSVQKRSSPSSCSFTKGLIHTHTLSAQLHHPQAKSSSVRRVGCSFFFSHHTILAPLKMLGSAR